MIEFMLGLPWLMFMIVASYENEVFKNDNHVRHARVTFYIALAIQCVALLGYILGKNA